MDLHSVVHFTPAHLHLHLPVHAFVHPQCNRMEHACEASLRVVHKRCHLFLLSLFQPHSLKLGIFAEQQEPDSNKNLLE